ncbi:MAG: DUF2267 domain-containing protein [Patescibacteria group bacterium]|nr:DUF2267 domain-containing protein [Patescibacteria group bacterium]
MNKKEFVEKVKTRGELKDLFQAESASKAVLNTLAKRITPEEEKDMESQLSKGERELIGERDEEYRTAFFGRLGLRKPVEKLHKGEFLRRVDEMTEHQLKNPEKATTAVFSTLKDQITKGEAEDIEAQLPKDLKETWRKS